VSHKFRELTVWRQAMSFVTEVYALTRSFPQHELFGLTSQIRRAAISIPLNIAEGAGCDTSNEFKRFLDIAPSSTYETMTALEISERLHYGDRDQIKPLLDEADQIAAMIVGLIKSLKARPDYRTVRELDTEYFTTNISDY